MNPLQLASCEELILELFSRTTFQGAIVYSTSPHRVDDQNHSNFNLTTTMTVESTAQLLEVTLGSLKSSEEN